MLPPMSTHRVAEPGTPEGFDASGCQSPMDRFYNPVLGYQSPATQFFEGPVLLSAAMPTLAPEVPTTAAGYLPQVWSSAETTPQMWAVVPSIDPSSATAPGHGASMFLNTHSQASGWGFTSPGMTETWVAVPSPDACCPSAVSPPVAADASCAGVGSQVPRAVFVDLSCLRERTTNADCCQLPAQVAGVARPLRRAAGRGRNR